MDYMVMSPTNPHTIRGRPTLKDVERGFSLFFIYKLGVIVPGVPCGVRGNWD